MYNKCKLFVEFSPSYHIFYKYILGCFLISIISNIIIVKIREDNMKFIAFQFKNVVFRGKGE